MQGDLFSVAADSGPAGAPELGLRHYQQTARERVADVHKRSRGALVILPTGTGKSRLCGAIAWDKKVVSGRTLILCPTIVLCQQMYEDMRKLGLDVGLEQADNYVPRPLPSVVIASVATMRGGRLASFAPDSFALVVADEAHRSASPQYGKIFDHFASANRLGLTATPDRVDGVSLANVYDEVAYDEMSMLRAIREGWLVPLRFRSVHGGFDPRRIRQVAGEVDPGSVARELVRSGLLHEAAGTLAELADGERTVAFLPTVAASQAFVAELLAREVSACHIDGTTPQSMREDAFRRFVAGDIRVLSNVGVLTEGWDCPAASVIALLNPTKSRSRITQMIGRGTRLAPGKTSTLVIDFCPGRLKKGRLASPADALAGQMLTDEQYDQMAEEGDLADEIARAEMKAEELEKKRLEREKRAAQRAARSERLKHLSEKRDYSYTTEEHDASELLAAEEQARAVEFERKAAGLWSPKQEKLLSRYGIARALTRSHASQVIGELATNGWRLTDKLRADRRLWTA